jgi:hypothetical protein
MPSKNNTLKIILWIARILGTITIIYLLFMSIGEFFSSEKTGTGLISTLDVLSLIFFPLSTIIGLALSYKWEGVGGIITVGGMIGLNIIRPDIASNLLISAFAIPGLLYIIYSVWSKK